MGFFDRFRGGEKEGVYPDPEFSAPKQNEEKKVEIEPVRQSDEHETSVAKIEQPTAQSESSTETQAEVGTQNESRSKNTVETYAEAHLVNKKYGDSIKNYTTAAEMNEKYNDGRESRRTEDLESLTGMGIEAVKLPAERLLVKAAEQNVRQATYFPNLKAEQYLYQELRANEDLIIGRKHDIRINGRDNFGVNEMEYLASKLNQELQTLKEPDGKGGFHEYPVVILQETQDTYSFITNSTGIEEDQYPRLFKLNKKNMLQQGYELEEKTDFTSIYPNKNE